MQLSDPPQKSSEPSYSWCVANELKNTHSSWRTSTSNMRSLLICYLSGFKRFYCRHKPYFPPHKILQVIKHTLVISKVFCRFNRLHFSVLTPRIILGNTVRGKKKYVSWGGKHGVYCKGTPCKPLRNIGGVELQLHSRPRHQMEVTVVPCVQLANMNIKTVFQKVLSSSLVQSWWCFGWACRLYLQGMRCNLRMEAAVSS
jgi:hypothetical protein